MSGFLKDTCGRPTHIHSPMVREVRKAVNAGIHNTIATNFLDIVQNLHVKFVTESSNIAKCSVKALSRRTIGRLVTKMNLKKGTAEQTTDARAIATADKLNSVSTSAAHFDLVPLTSPHLIMNVDATSVETGGGLTDGVQVIYDPLVLSNPEVILREVEKKELKEPAAIDIEGRKLKRKADAEARKANPKPKRVKKNVVPAVENVNVENL